MSQVITVVLYLLSHLPYGSSQISKSFTDLELDKNYSSVDSVTPGIEAHWHGRVKAVEDQGSTKDRLYFVLVNGAT